MTENAPSPRTIKARKKKQVKRVAMSRADRIAAGFERVEIIMHPEPYADLQVLVERSASGTMTEAIETAVTEARKRSDLA